MTTMTRRTALGSLGALVGLGLAGTATLMQADAKGHKHKKKKHKKGGKGNGNGNGGGNNGGGNNGGGNNPPPPPQFETVTRTFSHDGAVGILTEGPSKEYPSTLEVNGLAGGTITKVTARFPGFQHNFPSDVDILLVGPQGQNVVLMSDVGAQEDLSVLFDLTFDDDAPGQIPGSDHLTDGTFRPSNVALNDEFPAPAPAPDFNATLSVFKGTDPNGTWKLFIVDDAPEDGGVLIGGWSLTITAKVPA